MTLWSTCIGLALTGVALVTAQTCDPSTCNLPSCYCAKAGIPGGLSPATIPQIVLFMFEGSIPSLHYPYYEELFTDTRLNPNGCPIGATAFVSHNYTDYSAVRKLYLQGLEIAVNSVTRPLSDDWKNADQDMVKYEMLTQRENIEREAQIPRQKIWGWRSPTLQSAGALQFRVLQLNEFEYDSTVVTTGYQGNTNIPGWPFTLDFAYPEKCQIAPCPSEPYAGLWEIPVVPSQDIKDQHSCSYLGGCTNQPSNKVEVLEFLRKNFEANYKSTRAPVYFNLRTSWLSSETFIREGLIEFIDELVAKDDVYILTAHQLLAWVKDPQPLAKSKDFEAWSCPNFVNNDVSIWDHIKNIFTEGTGMSVIEPEVPVTQRPRVVNEIIYIGSGADHARTSLLIVGPIASSMAAFKLLLTV